MKVRKYRIASFLAMYDKKSQDEMIAELWYYIQTDPFYKDNTTLIITTDHGRGDKKTNWQNHGFWVKNSGQVWLGIIGPDVAPLGEVKTEQHIYQKQIAAIVSLLLGTDYTANHSIAKPFNILKKINNINGDDVALTSINK